MSEKKVKPLSELRKGIVIIVLIAALFTVFTNSEISIYSNTIKDYSR